jgi:hypothetical protein
LLEAESNTLSLSRCQFLWWFLITVYAYLFAFHAGQQLNGSAALTDIGGLEPLGVSLLTLVAAQGTSTVRGAKGAGGVRPSPADLITSGGALALDRLQQVAWTVIAGVSFLAVLHTTFASTQTLPALPQSMVTLMGISAAGYVAGKLARKQGPIITSVTLVGETITITGSHLSSRADGGKVFLDDTNVTDRITAEVRDSAPGDSHLRQLVITAPPSIRGTLGGHTLRVVNADGQFADAVPEAPPVIDSVQSGPLDGTVQLITIICRSALNRPQLKIEGRADAIQIDPTPGEPHKWTARIPNPGDVLTLPRQYVISTLAGSGDRINSLPVTHPPKHQDAGV